MRVQPEELVMSRFSNTMLRYMPRNRAKKTTCFSGWMGSPGRRNSATWLSLSLLMLM